MSFLSLSKGDPAARELLQRAIRARYGLRPLPVDSVRLQMFRQDKGPLGVPVKILVTLSFVTASHWRWDEVHKLFGIAISRSAASFDGRVYYERQGKSLSHYDEPRAVEGMSSRLWSEAAMMLTPLTSPGVTLRFVDDCTFQATPEPGSHSVATVHLNPDGSVAAIEAHCYHPVQKQELCFGIRPGDGLQTLNGFTIPRQLSYQWGNRPPETFTVADAVANPQIPLTEFSMG